VLLGFNYLFFGGLDLWCLGSGNLWQEGFIGWAVSLGKETELGRSGSYLELFVYHTI